MSRAKPSIDEVWNRIRNMAGETFETKTGKPFQFEIIGEAFRQSPRAGAPSALR